jgi:two-component system sensor histidine kinase/response regulator
MMAEAAPGPGDRVGPGALAPHSQPPSASGRSVVWIVDDSLLHGELSRQALASRYDVEVFSSGATMLERWVTGARPGLLLLDWYMPDISGVEVCRFVRNELNLAQLPILVLTGVATSAEQIEAFESGANDVIRKPVSEVELDARVAGLLRLASLHARLEQAERNLRIEAAFRERFMAMLAHDLRQPLNTILLARQVLSQEALSPKGVEVSEMQLRAAKRMQRMVVELLDFTRNRPETGLPIQRRTIDFAEIARLGLAEMRPAFPDQVMELSVEGSCEGEWDPDRVAQILSNLIGNAIEHGTPGGQVRVQLTGHPDRIDLRVSNRGPAMSRQLLGTIFEPFRRGGDGSSKSAGVGLGLHIVQQIVHAHGGTIAVQNQDGETQFTVSLPRAVPAAESRQQPTRAGSTSARASD